MLADLGERFLQWPILVSEVLRLYRKGERSFHGLGGLEALRGGCSMCLCVEWVVATCVLMESKRIVAWKGRDTTLSGWLLQASLGICMSGSALPPRCGARFSLQDVPGMPGLAGPAVRGPAESCRGQLSYTLKASYTLQGWGLLSPGTADFFFFLKYLYLQDLVYILYRQNFHN